MGGEGGPGGGVWSGEGCGGGQGGCERRIEVFGKIHKKKSGGGREGESGGGSGWLGVRVDANTMFWVEGDVGYWDVNQE